VNNVLRAAAIGGVLLLLAIALRSDWGPAVDAMSAPAHFPEPGSVAPDFALPLLGSEPPFVGRDTVRLSDFSGRYVYLDVFGSWCSPCRRKYPDMFDIADELNDVGAVILGLLLEDTPEAAAEYFAENGGQAYPFLVLDNETVATWGLTGAPMGFLISPEGRVERVCFGCQRGAARVETVPAAVRAGLTERYQGSSCGETRLLPLGSRWLG